MKSQKVQSEDEFEQVSNLTPPGVNQIESHLALHKSPLNSDPTKNKDVTLSKQETERPASPDKINNLMQKEKALVKAGVTRAKAYAVIAAALESVKWMDVVDGQGNVRRELLPDLDKQRWGCEMAVKMFGDLIERKEVEYGVSESTLEKFKALSVVELKARAADLLLGKTVSRLEPIDVEGEGR